MRLMHNGSVQSRLWCFENVGPEYIKQAVVNPKGSIYLDLTKECLYNP